MEVRGSLAAIALVVGAVGCAAPAGDTDVVAEAPIEEQPLEIGIDSLDVVHGALRLGATMTDGAADVCVRLGGSCDHREIGGGVSTRSTLVWSLGDEDLAAALACGLQVRARIREEGRRVDRVTEFSLSVAIGAQEGNPDDGPQLQSASAGEEGVEVILSAVPRDARLLTNDGVLEASPPETDEDAAADDGTARFVVPAIDFARSVLRGGDLRVAGASFVVSLAVGGTVATPPGIVDEAVEGGEITADEGDPNEPPEPE